MERIKTAIYNNCDESGFSDMIKNQVIPNKFLNVNLVENYNNTVDLVKGQPIAIADDIDCYGLDNINRLINILTDYCPEPELFRVSDVIPFCTCTILFKNMSRTGTHQLVRHRNAITQESQRYVDYSNACFNSPAKFKDIYDPNYKYPVTFGRSAQKMTLQEIGDNIAKIYGQLVNKDKLGKMALLKEDARSYLPSSIQCKKIFITFTWDYLFKFLQLREDKHAQAEIRSYAIKIGDWFAEQYPDFVCAYRENSGDASWMTYPIPNRNENIEVKDERESIIEVMSNAIETETIEMDKSKEDKTE